MGNFLCSRRQKLKRNKEPEQRTQSESEPQRLSKREQIPIVIRRSGCSHCKRSEEDWTCPNLGSCSCPRNVLPTPSCVFYSPRIQGLFEGERTELETTQEHWTQVEDKNDVEMERVGEENRKYFDEVLMKDVRWGGFFSKFEDLIVDEKIGEGGQAEIFAAKMKHGDYKDKRLVAKVFKKNMPLRDLKRQWPLEFLSRENKRPSLSWSPSNSVYGGAFIREGIHKTRFAFVMKRRECDLRFLIDQHMLKLVRTNSHGPPFGDIKDVQAVLQSIAYDMVKLHGVGVVHRDIKASNVLLGGPDDPVFCRNYLMDFECALGAMGTGFWRAPEILEQLQRGVPSNEVIFTEKGDIYSFGMLCYEVIIGCIPFDGHPQNDYSIVLKGGRPELPHDLNSTLRRLILDCWKGNPQHRPTAKEVSFTLFNLKPE